MAVHISQFYVCSKVSLAVELQYLVELGKYLHQQGNALSVDGIEFDKVLRKSRFWDYFRMGVDEGWIIDCGCKDIEINSQFPINYNNKVRNIILTEDIVEFDSKDNELRRNSLDYDYRTPLPKQVVFSSKENNYWVWDIKEGYSVNNATFNAYGSEDNWVSLIAYIAVKRLLTGVPQALLITVGYELTLTCMVLTSLMLLEEETKVCRGWCYYTFEDNISIKARNYLGYLAWYAKGEEMGYLKRYYDAKEKFNYAKKLDLQVGDIVFIYERSVTQQSSNIKEITGFHFAKITNIGEGGIGLQIVNTKKTLYQGEIDYLNYSMATKMMYNFNNPYKSFNSKEVFYNWRDIGVEYCMFDEKYFITECTSDDGKIMNVKEGDWSPIEIYLNSVELIYWILKDFNVSFNEERFISKYFSDEPLYVQYIKNGYVPQEYYVRKEK